ncbi:hypothetical protein [Spirosoma utsteinense]|uniref:Membrane protein n=1 Tax=Spirosoma utsteinense TaxID=2585773 RepID=A0ABR6WBI3_9BACT|nr:hypothetical protein [Spirosoma utsteinense]MBC3785319.1 putative membrane protein [Spirosoma utsteinense]MBC3793877.1 putative membrane protein [Spirosoma utsteinense]
MIITYTSFQFILLAMITQLFMTIVFAREALTTALGTYCRVKCGVAGLVYFIFAFILTWILFNSSIDRDPA